MLSYKTSSTFVPLKLCHSLILLWCDLRLYLKYNVNIDESQGEFGMKILEFVRQAATLS